MKRQRLIKDSARVQKCPISEAVAFRREELREYEKHNGAQQWCSAAVSADGASYHLNQDS